MSNNPSDNFFNDIDYPSIIDTIKGVYTSDGTINSLLDFERVLDESDLYAFKNWELGELVSGPDIKRYVVSCVFMYPEKLMPDPRGGKRLIKLGCTIKFKKTKIKVPVKIETPDDFEGGTHYPKMVERDIWLVYIQMPKELMNDIREGSIDLADQTIDLDDLDNAYEEDLDKDSGEDDDNNKDSAGGDMGLGGIPATPAPAAQNPAPGAF
jgi:hypothetical protein